jgi:hypothetical protein
MNMFQWAPLLLSINQMVIRIFRIARLGAVCCVIGFPLPVAAQKVSCSSVASAQELHRTTQQQEVVIAKEKSLYIVMDLSREVLELKARGLLLKAFPFQGFSWVGEPWPKVTVTSLNQKIPLIEPQPTIPSFAKEDGSLSPAEARPLVVTDMPHRYTVEWGEGFSMVIQSEKINSVWDHVFEPTVMWANRLTTRVSHWGAGIFGSPSSRDLVLDMTPAEAQALYWALVSPMKMLIVPASCSGDGQ